MPNLIGLSVGQAKRELEPLGQVHESDYTYLPEGSKKTVETVTGQDPQFGTVLQAKGIVRIGRTYEAAL